MVEHIQAKDLRTDQYVCPATLFSGDLAYPVSLTEANGSELPLLNDALFTDSEFPGLSVRLHEYTTGTPMLKSVGVKPSCKLP